MSSVNSYAVTSPLYGIVGRQFCHALIAVQYLLLSTGLWGRQGCQSLIPVQSLLLCTGI